MGQQKLDKNAHILTVNIAVLPSLSDTISLSSSPIYSESSSFPSSESSTLCLLSSSIKMIHPMLQKANISFTRHRIFTDLNVKTIQQEVIEFSTFIGRKFVFNRFQFGSVFLDNKNGVRGTRASFHRWREHNCKDGTECVKC